MKLNEVQTMLESTGFPTAYNAFTEEEVASKGITLPFITWMNDSDDSMGADNRVYYKAHHIQAELYEEYRDEEAEAKIETALADIYYNKIVAYVESEKMYQITYEFEV